ncbi:MAG: ABC transporter permease [Stenotrophobium sp.]
MKRYAALCLKELLLLARDKHGLLVLFAVPTVFILIMSLAMRDAFNPQTMIRLPVVVINQDGGQLSQRLEADLRHSQNFVMTDVAHAQIRVLLLKGFSELLATRYDFAGDYLKGATEPTLLDIEYAPTVMPQLKTAAALTLRQMVQAVQSDYLLETVLGYPKDKIRLLRYVNDPRNLPIAENFIAQNGQRMQPPTSVQQNVPAWLIFAIFFTVIPLATTFVIERNQGSLLRLRALNVSALELFVSKAVPYYLVNLVQMALMLAIGVWLVPLLGGDRMTLGHSPFGLWLIGTATSFAAISLALLVAVSVRTTVQATIAGGAISLILAALGGIMVPKLVMPPMMQQLTQISPMAWSLEGFWAIVLRQGGWQDVLPQSGVLLLFGLLCLVLAGAIFRHNQ